MNALEHLLSNPTNYQLGPAIRLLGMSVGSKDPLADGNWDSASVRIRQYRLDSIALHEVLEIRHLNSGQFELTTPVLNVIGVTGIAAKRLGMTSNDSCQIFDKVTHRLVADWYRSWTNPMFGKHVELAMSRTRSAAGLEAMLASVFNLPISIEEAVGAWVVASNGGGSRNVVYDPSAYCQLTIGPVDLGTFESLRPEGMLMREMLEKSRLYAGVAVRFRCIVLLRQEDVPTARIGAGKYGRGAVVGNAVRDASIQFHEIDFPV
jgi:predicted component of type VI protein secretion system